MKALIHFLLDPLRLVLLLWVVALLCRKRKRVRNTALIISGVWLFIVVVSPLTIWWARHLENQYPVFRNTSVEVSEGSPIHIVVLGAGFVNDPDLVPTSQLNATELGRLVEGIRVYRMFENARIITSGGALWRNLSQAEAVSSAAISLGVSVSDTFQLSATRNTEDEALKYVRKFGKSHKVVIATDAIHMKRALFWFRSHGIDATAAPCNFKTKEDPLRPESTWKLSLNKADLMGDLTHELVGYWYAQYKHK